jgi:hypothetical protein
VHLVGVIKIMFETVCMIFIPYIRGISEKFKSIGETFYVKTVCKTKYILRLL